MLFGNNKIIRYCSLLVFTCFIESVHNISISSFFRTKYNLHCSHRLEELSDNGTSKVQSIIILLRHKAQSISWPTTTKQNSLAGRICFSFVKINFESTTTNLHVMLRSALFRLIPNLVSWASMNWNKHQIKIFFTIYRNSCSWSRPRRKNGRSKQIEFRENHKKHSHKISNITSQHEKSTLVLIARQFYLIE